MNRLNLTTGFEGNEFGQSNSVFETDCEPIRNTVTMKLDGNKENDWTSYCQTMAQVKAWFMSNGTAVDVSELVGE